MFKFDDEKMQKNDVNVANVKTLLSKSLASSAYTYMSGLLHIMLYSLMILNIFFF